MVSGRLARRADGVPSSADQPVPGPAPAPTR